MVKIDFCTLAPEKLPKVVFIDVSSACEAHDFDYGLIYKRPNNKKYRMIRKEYDRQFKENLRLLGAPAVFCWVYWAAVRCFGWVGLWGKEDVKGLV